MHVTAAVRAVVCMGSWCDAIAVYVAWFKCMGCMWNEWVSGVTTGWACIQGRSLRGDMGASPPPVTVGQFLSPPRWCSLGFPYSAPGSRWGLLSVPIPLVCPLINFWLRACLYIKSSLALDCIGIDNQTPIESTWQKLSYRRDERIWGHYAFQGHSRSLISIPMENARENSY